MTPKRFAQLRKGAKPRSLLEVYEYRAKLGAITRREGAERATRTKRKKYRTWPSRANTHR